MTVSERALQQVISFKVVGKLDLNPKHLTMFNYEDKEYEITVGFEMTVVYERTLVH